MCTHLSQELTFSILTVASLQYLPSCFSLIFLKGYCSFLASEITFLYLDPIVWELLVPLQKNSVLYQYFICFLFSSSSASLYFSAFSLILALVIFLAFWAICSTWWVSATSSKWAWSCCSSLCLLCIFCHCSSSISELFWEMLERIEKNMIIQKKDKIFFFSVYVLLT